MFTKNGYITAKSNNTLTFAPWCRGWERFTIYKQVHYTKTHNKIKIYYRNKTFNSDYYNVGDLLSAYIVSKITQTPVEWCPFTFKTFMAIGSLINNETLSHKSIFWGSGAMVSSLQYFPENTFCAVRGPITRYNLISFGYKCPDVYGDPALLLPLYYHKKPTKKYKLGVICHWRHRDLVFINDPDVKYIDILRKKGQELSFIDDICQCEKIISSSLHGIIIANAYGIPARWFIIKDYSLGGIKFHDYFSSVHLPLQVPLILNRGEKISSIYVKYVDNFIDIKINLSLLVSSFPIT